MLLHSLTAWHWLSFGVLLLALELLLSNGFFLGLAIATGIIAACLFLFAPFSWLYQFALFSVLALLSTILWWTRFRQFLQKPAIPLANQRGKQYIGRIFTLTAPIINGRGRVRIGDNIWLVAGPDLPTGTAIRIVDCEGLLLNVQPSSTDA